MDNDGHFMKMALALAKRGEGLTSPNPLVGTVLVKNGRVLSKGYHKRAGSHHAEIIALNKAGKKAMGSTLYVTLEPCVHHGKTPPCVDRIIKEGVKRVVIGARDPNPINNGRGMKRLRREGVDVVCGVLRSEAERLNRAFNVYITKKRPYVSIKAAQSLDGKIATFSGNSKWITNRLSRNFAHNLRGRVDAVLVGVNTVIKDDPRLSARAGNPKKQPIKIVLDSRLRAPLTRRLFKNGKKDVIVAATVRAPKERVERFRRAGIEVVLFKEDRGVVDIRALLRYLAKRGISHLLVEGGGSVIASFIDKALADEVFIFISPRIIGGRDATTSVEGRGAGSLGEAVRLKFVEVKKLNGDILIHADVYRNN
ncbi:MAG: bifunctional diaminohydroxyphosphoribosylaminopyrimidine deaminase/5-amino-6-(5-phosphoribosylamino)uracil reductase RibD [Candidatus Omnitrophota bacterium]